MLQILRVDGPAWLYLLFSPAWLVAAQNVASRAHTPVELACQQNFTLVRMAGPIENQTFSPFEASYVQARRSRVIPQAWKTYLTNAEGTNVALPSYVSDILEGRCSQTPNFSIAMSRGGYRASIFDAGVLNVLDGRNNLLEQCRLGCFASRSHLYDGVARGALVLTSLAQAGFPTMQDLIFGHPDGTTTDNVWGGWSAERNPFAPSSNPRVNAEYVTDAIEEVRGNYEAGNVVTLADIWARYLARHFLNGTTGWNFYDPSYSHGAGSSLAETELFISYSIPFPIFVANLPTPGEESPDMVIGEFLLLSNPLMFPGVQLDVASWPNPSWGVERETFIAPNESYLSLVDGSENGENIPFQPLLVKARGVDTILAIDSTPDGANNFAGGGSLIRSQSRSMLLSRAYSFPPVPASHADFAAEDLTTRPTFFGCHMTIENVTTPLIVYLANGGPPRNGDAPVTNTSTYQFAYNASQIQAMLDQTFIIATQGYPEDPSQATDPEWPACLACAIVDRARERAGEARCGVCETCFASYYWS